MSGRAGGQDRPDFGDRERDGRAAALHFTSEGATVVGCDIDEESQAETDRLVRESGGVMHSMAPADLGDEEGAKRWVDWAVEQAGGVDILYNNAGAVRLGDFSGMPADDWYFTIRNELHIVHFSTSAAWPHLIARGGGCVVNVSSTAGIRGLSARFWEMAAHGAAKGGVLAYTYHLAAAGGPHKIRANVILPGLVRTPETEPLFQRDDQPAMEMVNRSPTGRPGEPEDVPRVAAFLASDEASSVNAAEIRVDGGQAAVMI